MQPRTYFLIAGEPSGDMLAAELVQALRLQDAANPFPSRFAGAGGPRMSAAGVELAFDMTAYSVIGLWEALRRYRTFRGLMDQLLNLALKTQPEAIICVDFSGFNRRFARALRDRVHAGPFHNWRPRIIQYVSPQVWASRPGRAQSMAEDFNLLLSIFPFEAAWYARHAPRLPVTFVGHPLFDRYAARQSHESAVLIPDHCPADAPPTPRASPRIVLLPGSRVSELVRHLPVMLRAWQILRNERPNLRATLIVTDATMRDLAASFRLPREITLQIGGLAGALEGANLAIASTGTVTLECAYFGVPTVALYRTSWTTYQIGKHLVTVKYLAMPNLLADAPLFPEFIQQNASPENLARAAASFLADPHRCAALKAQLRELMTSLGGPGASHRAARAIRLLLNGP